MDEGTEETEEAVVWPSLSSLKERVGTSAFRGGGVLSISGISVWPEGKVCVEVGGRDAGLCA